MSSKSHHSLRFGVSSFCRGPQNPFETEGQRTRERAGIRRARYAKVLRKARSSAMDDDGEKAE